MILHSEEVGLEATAADFTECWPLEWAVTGQKIPFSVQEILSKNSLKKHFYSALNELHLQNFYFAITGSHRVVLRRDLRHPGPINTLLYHQSFEFLAPPQRNCRSADGVSGPGYHRRLVSPHRHRGYLWPGGGGGVGTKICCRALCFMHLR